MLLRFLLVAVSAADVYSNFADLERQERRDRDFRVVIADRQSPVTIMAIHAGWIEPGTGELAREVASDKVNLYLFEGIKDRGNENLHITSEHFDEPEALRLAARSRFCLSLHGYKDAERAALCVGGAAREKAEALAQKLKASHYTVIFPCETFAGSAAKNIVNRCQAGVQLELSSKLRKNLLADENELHRLGQVLRSALP